MSITLSGLLTTERQRYYDLFTEMVATLQEGKSTYATELALQTEDEEIPDPFNIIRVDFLYKDEKQEDSISEIRPQDNPTFEPLEFELDDLIVNIHPFCWNSCEITANKINIPALAEWLNIWLRIDNEEDGQLAEAVHSCYYPEQTEDGFIFTIDFGTAPIDAFTDLLQVLIDSNCTEATFETLDV